MRYTFVFLLLISISFAANAHNKDTIGAKELRFYENKGQWDKSIFYKADFNDGYLQCQKTCLRYTFRDQTKLNNLLTYKLRSKNSSTKPDSTDFIINYHTYLTNFVNSNQDVKISATGAGKDYSNYMLGNDKSKWASKVLNYSMVEYLNIYDNIDLQLFEKDHLYKYQFIVHKNADPKEIILEYEGTDGISIQNRNLIIKTSVNKVTELAPKAFQIIDGKEQIVKCEFKLKGNRVTFYLPEGYNKNFELIIDPVIIFSTFTGSLSDNWGFTATYDEFGNTYSGGISFNNVSNGYPVSVGAYQVNFAGGEGTYYGGCDIGLIKYDSSGHNRIFATYLGGSRNDLPHSIVVDGTGNLLLFGTTGSNDYPVTHGAFDSTFNGGTNITYDNVLTFNLGVDIFVSKISSDGSQLLSSTFVGGTGNDGLNFFAPLAKNYADGARGEILTDENNNVYVVSTTSSTNFPVSTNAFQQTYAGGSLDGCIFVIDNSLQSMIWSSYLGGSNIDAVYGIVLDNLSNVYVCGGTNSTNFPTTAGVLHPTFAGGTVDGFITKIAANGSSILKSTYYGSTFYDQTYLMDRSKDGKIYVFGQTDATGNEFINNAIWNHPGGGQFISKLSPDLNSIVWSTAFGTGNGGPDISPTAFLVDLCDKIYLSGWGGNVNGFGGTAGLPITGNAYQSTTDNSDFYLMVINDDASALVYGTYFGGPVSLEHVDGGTSRFDRKGKIYQSVCAGCGGNSDFPTTPGAWSNTNNSVNCNNGTFKFDFMLPLTIADFQTPPITCIPDSVNFINTSHTGGAGMDYYWSFGDGQNSTQQNPVHFYNQSGVYTVVLAVADTGTCNGTDTITKQVVVLSNSSEQLPTKYICLGDFVQIGIIPIPDTSVSYNWNPITGLSNPHVSNPIAQPTITTDYTCLVSNGNCTDTLRQTVVVFDLHAYTGPDTSTCSGIVDLTANSSGGVTFFQWSSNPNFTDTLNSSTADSNLHINITTNSTFYILVKNPYCQDVDSVKITMVVLGGDTLFIDPACHDYCDGMATVQPTNGTSPYTYLWSTGSINDTIYNLCADPYSVTIHDAQNCILTINFSLQNPTPLVANLNVVNMHCPTSCVGQITVNAAGSNPPYFYSWSNGQSGNPLTDLCPGAYSVTVSDTKNCNLHDSAVVIIDSIFNNINVWADKDTIYEGQSTGLHSTHVPGCTYTWSPGSSLDNAASPDPIASPLVTTTYILTISDGAGCNYQDTITIFVIDVICEEPYVFMPNAFTPNGDNLNDVLYVRTNFAESVFFEIYDRWGEKLFESNSSSVGWDGKYKGKMCNPGVYVYVLDVTCYNKQHFRKKGNVTLIR